MAETRQQDLDKTKGPEKVFEGTLFDFMNRVSFKDPRVEEIITSTAADREISLQDFVTFCRVAGQVLQERGFFASAAECFALGFYQQRIDNPEDEAIQKLAKSYVMAMANHFLRVHQQPLPLEEKLSNLFWFDGKLSTYMEIIEAVDPEDQEAQLSARNMFMALYFIARGRTPKAERPKEQLGGDEGVGNKGRFMFNVDPEILEERLRTLGELDEETLFFNPLSFRERGPNRRSE